MSSPGRKAPGLQPNVLPPRGLRPNPNVLPAPPASVKPASQSSLPFFFAILLLFTHFARPFDNFLVGFRLPAIICSVCIVVVWLFGGVKYLFSSSVGKACVCLVGWMCVSAPFSVWKGGSFSYVMWYAQFFLPLMLLLAIASRTPKDMVRLSGVLAFSCICHLVLHATELDGRFSLNGTFGNPDDVALLAGFTIPFLVLFVGSIKNPVVRYAGLLGGCGYLLLVIGKTATRAAIPALICLLGVYFVRSKGAQKIGLLVFAVLGCIGAVMVLPPSTLQRLSTLMDAFNPSPVYEGMTEAEASALERHEIVRDAIATTLANPLVGIGAGMFAQYRYEKMLYPDGKHKPYLPTHNTWLEISSESGIPAVLLYLVFLFTIYNQTRNTRKLIAGRNTPLAEMLSSIVLCLEGALIYFAVCATFMTCDKHPHQFAMAGFAIALQLKAKGWLADEDASIAAAPAQTPVAKPAWMVPRTPGLKRPSSNPVQPNPAGIRY